MVKVEFYVGDSKPTRLEEGGIYVDRTNSKLYVYSDTDTLLQFDGKNITPNKELKKNNWALIKEVADSGSAAEYWSVGDEIDVTMVDGKTITFVILGFNHDDKAEDSGKAGITFGMKNLLADYYTMDSSDATDGWENCDMRKTTMSELYEKLPDDVKAVITPVKKYTCRGFTSDGASFSSTIVTTTDKLFLFSEREIYGTNNYSGLDEGTQYDYYLNGGANTNGCDICTKYMDNGASCGSIWWLRSPISDGYVYFCNVCIDGYLDYYVANSSYGVCLGFAV